MNTTIKHRGGWQTDSEC